ncbi:MAG TPA: hypothetical protein VHW09_28800 [Bryobacteraceae bacterium]|jgi:hypothetical protein|nr:hypothetical protein [Bryobacteraceae bacterium]
MRYSLLLCCVALLFAGTETKPKVDDYDVHLQEKNLAVGADFTVHSYSRGEQMYIARDYLVVEVALFPAKGTEFEVHDSDFTLRINGKTLIDARAPDVVVGDMRHPEYKPERGGLHPEVMGGVGGIGAKIGGPPVNSNPYPGTQVPGTPPAYPPVEIPRDNPSGVTAETVDPYELLMQTALEEGSHRAPISGFVYFPFRGNLKSVKTLELVYGDAVLKLR